MDPVLLWKGVGLGFSIAAPVGPIGLLCIRRTLAHGRMAGFVSGLGAAAADTLWALIGGMGLTVIASALLGAGDWLRIAGGLFLLYLGVRIFREQPAVAAPADDRRGVSGGLGGHFLSTLLLTLTNPATILAFAAMFAGVGLDGSSPGAAAALAAGVFLGSAAWWLLLSYGSGLFASRVDGRAMRWVNRLGGLGLASYGLSALFPA